MKTPKASVLSVLFAILALFVSAESMATSCTGMITSIRTNFSGDTIPQQTRTLFDIRDNTGFVNTISFNSTELKTDALILAVYSAAFYGQEIKVVALNGDTNATPHRCWNDLRGVTIL